MDLLINYEELPYQFRQISLKGLLEFCRFLDIALGSAYEVETQLLIASGLKFIPLEEVEPVANKLNTVIKMITRFKTTLK